MVTIELSRNSTLHLNDTPPPLPNKTRKACGWPVKKNLLTLNTDKIEKRNIQISFHAPSVADMHSADYDLNLSKSGSLFIIYNLWSSLT